MLGDDHEVKKTWDSSGSGNINMFDGQGSNMDFLDQVFGEKQSL